VLKRTRGTTILDQRFFTSEFLTWELVASEGSGPFWKTLSLLVFISYEEVERHLVYTGPEGIRCLFFPHKGSNRSVRLQMSQVLKKTRSALSRKQSSSSVGSATSHDSYESGKQRSPRSSSKRSTNSNSPGGSLPPPLLVYHESARSIVFRDHLRRAADVEQAHNHNEPKQSPDTDTQQYNDHEHCSEDLSTELSAMNALFGDPQGGAGGFMNERIAIQGFTPNIVPFPHLELGPNDQFEPLMDSDNRQEWTQAEMEVVEMLENEKAVVKTIKNNDWTEFLHRFKAPRPPKGSYPDDHNDIPSHEGFPFNSFVTSTTILPSGGKKMRCFGAAAVYTTGVVFGLPKFKNEEAENKATEATRTVGSNKATKCRKCRVMGVEILHFLFHSISFQWSWPSGYSAKTEFNIDSHGKLINGRLEALTPFSTLRQYNDDYLHKEDHMIAGRLIKGGLKTVPYNEVFVRIGGPGRIVDGKDMATGEGKNDSNGTGRSLDKGVGLPVALFVRTPTFGHLISLLRTRARLMHVWGEKHIQGIPLLYIAPDKGIRVLTDKLQRELLRIASSSLNPFQNPLLHKTTIDNTDERQLETKLEELIDLDESIREMLTPEECARLAGGFGATDESIAQILKDAMIQDKQSQKEGKLESESRKLQDIVNEGLASAVRSGDYYTSRQLLILYSLVASEGHHIDAEEKLIAAETGKDGQSKKRLLKKTSLDSEAMLLKRQADSSTLTINSENSRLPPPPPPPPLDTDRLRSATNSDGLLAVLGAAQVLKSIRDGSAKNRSEESFLAVEE
jgi:hypothetical protein